MHEQPQIPQYKLTLNLASVGTGKNEATDRGVGRPNVDFKNDCGRFSAFFPCKRTSGGACSVVQIERTT